MHKTNSVTSIKMTFLTCLQLVQKYQSVRAEHCSNAQWASDCLAFKPSASVFFHVCLSSQTDTMHRAVNMYLLVCHHWQSNHANQAALALSSCHVHVTIYIGRSSESSTYCEDIFPDAFCHLLQDSSQSDASCVSPERHAAASAGVQKMASKFCMQTKYFIIADVTNETHAQNWRSTFRTPVQCGFTICSELCCVWARCWCHTALGASGQQLWMQHGQHTWWWTCLLTGWNHSCLQSQPTPPWTAAHLWWVARTPSLKCLAMPQAARCHTSGQSGLPHGRPPPVEQTVCVVSIQIYSRPTLRPYVGRPPPVEQTVCVVSFQIDSRPRPRLRVGWPAPVKQTDCVVSIQIYSRPT